jgi:hypothetical protein
MDDLPKVYSDAFEVCQILSGLDGLSVIWEGVYIVWAGTLILDESANFLDVRLSYHNSDLL